jgi:glucose-1-phosphate adenylyltransferase
MEKVLAMVLAGGRVDELLCLTEGRPKSALPIFGIYRIIDFPLSNLMNSGIYNVGILSQYRPYALLRHIGAGAHWDFIGRKREIRILPPYRGAKESDWYRGTADAVYQNISYIKELNPEYVLVISADHVYRMDYKLLLHYHIEKDADATICFTKVKTKSTRFGYGMINKNGKLVKYLEKPTEPLSDWISMTVYVFKTNFLVDILKSYVLKKLYEFGRDIIPNIISKNRVYGYKFNDYWAYARTIESFYETNMDLLKRKIDLKKWQIRTNLYERCIDRDRPPAYVNGDVSNSVVSEGCKIKGKVKNSILSPGVIVENGAAIIDSIIFHDTRIENNAKLKKVICDKDVQISKASVVGGIDENIPSKKFGDLLSSGITILGKGANIPQKTEIRANTMVCASEEIKDLNL